MADPWRDGACDAEGDPPRPRALPPKVIAGRGRTSGLRRSRLGRSLSRTASRPGTRSAAPPRLCVAAAGGAGAATRPRSAAASAPHSHRRR
jgi:hypothetical protein